jgi:hypothetical protein
MYRNEHVSLGDARAPDSIPQDQELIAVAGQNGPHAGLAVYAFGQQTSDRQNDILFMGAAGSGRTWVLSTMAGIDRDNDVAIRINRGMGCADNPGRGIRFWRSVAEIDNQLTSSGAGFRHPSNAGGSGRVQLDHYSKGPSDLVSRPDIGNDPGAFRSPESTHDAGVGEVYNHAARPVEREHFLSRRARHIQCQLGGSAGRGQASFTEFSGCGHSSARAAHQGDKDS